MKKRFLTILMVGVMTFTLISCSKNKDKVANEPEKPQITENKEVENDNEEIKEIKVSKEEMVNIANGYFNDFEKLLKEDGQPIYKADNADGVIVTDYIGLETAGKKSEPYKVFNCDLTAPETSNGTAGFTVYIEYPINPEDVAKGKEIKIQDIGFEKYSNVLLKDKTWDYEKINKAINDKLKNLTDQYETVEYGRKDGMGWSFTVYKDSITYELGTSMYTFK